jgi:hypothetical protein
MENIKEQLLDRLRSIWGQIRESTAYIQLREKYEELSPPVQKAVIWSAIGFIVLIVFSMPLLNLQSASQSVSAFEESKETLRNLLAVQREIAQAPDVPVAPAMEQIQSRVQSILTEIGLATEQIVQLAPADTKSDPPTALIPASVSQRGVTATLLKLNLKQIIDISYQLQNIAPNVFVTSMDMTANKQDNHYYDVVFRVVGFAIDLPAESAAEPADGGSVKPPPPKPPPPGGGK